MKKTIIVLMALAVASGCSLFNTRPAPKFTGSLSKDAVKKICIYSAPKAKRILIYSDTFTSVPTERQVFEALYSDDHPFLDKWSLSGTMLLPVDCKDKSAVIEAYLGKTFPGAAVGYGESYGWRGKGGDGHRFPCIVTSDGLVFIEPALNEIADYGWKTDFIVIGF